MDALYIFGVWDGVPVVIILVQEVSVDQLPGHKPGTGDKQDGEEHVSSHGRTADN